MSRGIGCFPDSAPSSKCRTEMKIRIKRRDSPVAQTYEATLSLPTHLVDGTVELVAISTDGVATLTLSRRERDALLRYLPGK